MKRISSLIFSILVCFSFNVFSNNDASMNLFYPNNPAIRYIGRIDFENPETPKFISAGSYCTFRFKGSSCLVVIDSEYEGDGYGFIAVECDGKYLGRTKIVKGNEKYLIADGLTDSVHTIRICKATEAITGYIELKSIQCTDLTACEKIPTHRIECIGNSITSGAQSDTTDSPCNTGVWHENHNAYLAYGPILARSLNSDWLLSSVSGMGLTRNWNNEGPALPAYYDNLYLNADSAKPWTGKEYKPELITICLGTNDNSEGDGSYERKVLDSTTFINAYIRFIKHIHQLHPDAVICLINSPVFDGDLKNRFDSYLKSIVDSVRQELAYQRIHYTSYKYKYKGGCGGHPSTAEQQKMADELLPFIKSITGW
jgi:lysophospholipase L1-like esterase